VDRLDTWLNAQRGWRRLALLWLQLYLPSALIINAYLSWRNLFAEQTSGTELVWLLTLPFPCAAVLIGPRLLAQARMERRARKRGSFLPPLLSWRFTGFLLFLAAEMILPAIAVANPFGWKHQHRLVGMIMFICAICFIVLSLENVRYIRRMRQLAHGPAIHPSPTTT
jgi:hypothetical protein